MDDSTDDEVRCEWVELRVTVPEVDPLLLEPLDAACMQVAPGGFVVEGPDAPPGDDPPPAAGTSRYRVYVGLEEAEAARLLLANALARWPAAEVLTAPLPEDWRDRWKRWFVPLDVASDLVVTPPWHLDAVRARVAPGTRLVVIEPGMAFGTGQHETTWVCLEGIRALAHAGALPDRVLDVGAGTGVLAIAAALFGASDVLGVDNDPVAVRAADVNARDNAVGARFAGTPIAEVEGTWGLVIANILTHILVGMAPALVARVAPGGRLMLSGILVEQAEEIVWTFTELGLRHDGTHARGGWVRVDFTA